VVHEDPEPVEESEPSVAANRQQSKLHAEDDRDLDSATQIGLRSDGFRMSGNGDRSLHHNQPIHSMTTNNKMLSKIDATGALSDPPHQDLRLAPIVPRLVSRPMRPRSSHGISPEADEDGLMLPPTPVDLGFAPCPRPPKGLSRYSSGGLRSSRSGVGDG